MRRPTVLILPLQLVFPDITRLKQFMTLAKAGDESTRAGQVCHFSQEN
jgi:hypothetical protein